MVIKTKNYEWDFKDFFESDKQFEGGLVELKKNINELKLMIDTNTLYELLEKYYDLSLMCEKLFSYAELKFDIDMSNQKYLKFKNEAYEEKSKLDVIKNTINQKILLMNDSLDKILKKNPELKEYRMHLYDVLRLKNHNQDNEFIQSLTTTIPKINDLYQTIQNVELEYKNVIIDGKKISANLKNYSKYLLDSNRNNRKKIFNAFLNSLAKVNKSISSLLNMRLKFCYDISKAKGYNSVLEQMLEENDLKPQIIDNLIKSVNSNLSLLTRYFNLKKQDLKLGSLKHYDLNLIDSFDKEVSFEEVLEIVKQSLKIMGESYNVVLEKVVNGGCLDICPRKNKISGGYHWRNYTKPMILMNYNGSFGNIYTVTHELGHAVNGLLIKEKQSFQNFHFSVFLSEIASKVNENILDDYLYKNATSNKEKRYILEQRLNNFVGSVFMQTLFLEFELALNNLIENSKSLSSDIINDTYYNLYKKYYSAIEEDEQIKYLWQTRLHLFYGQYRYYNFQYATGLIISLKIANDIINGNNNKLNEYLEFLSIGGSAPTLDSLKIVGINFDSTALFDESMIYFERLLNEYEIMLGEKN